MRIETIVTIIMHWTWIVLVYIATVNCEDLEEWRTVRITQGPVRGRYNAEYGIYTFYDIPYATAPTGTERFKAPRPPPVWTTTFDAVDRGIACPQLFPFYTVQEDCLVASVSVPNTQETNLPVAINIHGGGFQMTYGNFETLNSLVATQKIIAVTFNYRLGPHGFLCLGTEDAPGNAGLKDQIALLRWVNQNIASFGGNPDDVTIMGCSAGGGSVDILTLSKLANGLYNKAIVESGVSTGAVGVSIDPIENAKVYARAVNFTNVDDIVALEEFYKTASFQTLFQDLDTTMMTKDGTVLFGPCIEKDLGQESFLEDAPLNIVSAGNYAKVPLLYGFSNLEGLIRIMSFNTWQHAMNEKFSDFLPGDLQFANDEEKEEVAKRVKSFYFGDNPVSTQTISSYIDYFTDQMFAYPMLRQLTLRLQSSNDTIYLFDYSFYEENPPLINMFNVRGAGHCDQALIVRDENEFNMSEEYSRMKYTMREIWLNFIITGKPIPDGSQLPPWPPATAARTPHMSLGREIKLQDVLLEERNSLWDSIYKEHYRYPEPPAPEITPTTPSNAGTFSKMSNILVAFILMYYVCL